MSDFPRDPNETREEAIERIMRDLTVDRNSAEAFFEIVEGRLGDAEQAE